MREIKFRAWDTVMHSWVVFVEEQIEIAKINRSGHFTLKQFDPPRFTLMQFTGLRDKNGKEIYEGDIVSHNCGRKTCEVYWQAPFGRWGAKSNAEHFYVLSALCCEIIGNIHENQELLH